MMQKPARLQKGKAYEVAQSRQFGIYEKNIDFGIQATITSVRSGDSFLVTGDPVMKQHKQFLSYGNWHYKTWVYVPIICANKLGMGWMVLSVNEFREDNFIVLGPEKEGANP